MCFFLVYIARLKHQFKHPYVIQIYNCRPHLKDHGSVDISASGISLSVSVDVKANKTDGHMQLNSTGCSFNIDTIKVDFHGGARSAIKQLNYRVLPMVSLINMLPYNLND